MKIRRSPHLHTATALAAALMLAACGGGSGEAPPLPPSAAADTSGPVVTITDSVVDATATGDVTFSFAFNEDVGTSFTADDVTVSGGTKGAFTRVSGALATLVVSPTRDAVGMIEVSVAARAATDAVGNGNAATGTQQAFNTVIPVVQTVLVNFSEATPPALLGFGGAEDATVVVDPTDGSNRVAKIVKSATAELWAGTTVAICPSDALVRLPFSATQTTLTARVWSPNAGIPVRLKVEDASDSTKSVETEALTTVAGAWQTLQFNFATPAAGTAALNLATRYNKASIFFNFGTTGVGAGGAKTYYLDDIAFRGSSFAVACPAAGGGGAATATTITMDEASAPMFAGFGGAEDAVIAADPTNAANKVARVIKSATAELWAGTTFSNLPNQAIAPIGFSAGNTTITVRVWAPAAGIPVRLKVESATDNTKTVETEATTTVAAGWQTLSFNFANPAPGTAALVLTQVYNKASIFFNFGKTGAQGGGGTYYFEDVSYPAPAAAGGGGSGGGMATASAITMEESPPPSLTGFGGAEDAFVVADPTNAANKVARVIKSATAELWAGTTVSTLPNQAIPRIGFSAANTTVTARVWAAAAGIPVRLKVESATDPTKTVETEATTTVAGGWQTLSFNFANPAAGTAALVLTQSYDKISVFFNFGKSGAQGGGGTYYIDDITYPAPAASGGGSGSAGTLAGGVYAAEYTGNLDPAQNQVPRTTLGGDVGFYYDPRLVNNKYYDFGGISGPAQNPGGVNNFYYGFGLKLPAITDAYFGAYVNAPANGTVDVSGYTNMNVVLWGPAELFEKSFTPAIQVVIAGPAVAGCASNSGRSEVQRIIPAAQKIGAASNYALGLSGFALKFACSGETTVAQVLAKMAQVNFTLVNSNVQYSVPDTSNPPAYANGLNIGPIRFD